MKNSKQEKKIIIADTTLRDGEQAPGYHMAPVQKFTMARQLAELGVDVMEVGFPASSPADFEAVERVAKEIGRAVNAPEIGALARSMAGDIDAAWHALKSARRPRIHTFISSSDIHLEHKLKMTRKEAVKKAVEGVKRAALYTSSVQFSPEDASRSDRSFLAEMIEAVIDAGATTINITDTVGYATPSEFGELVCFIGSRVRNIQHAVISVHCHNDLGLAVANSLTAVQAGAVQVECTVGGIGERAGNCSLEEFVMAGRVRRDIYRFDTGINVKKIFAMNRVLSEISGQPIPLNKPIVGRNAFSHASGVHQDGMIKFRSTYEIMKPEDIGRPGSELVLTSRSGKNAFFHRLKELGFSVDPTKVEGLFQRFKSVADQRMIMTDQDLKNLLSLAS